MKTCKALGLGLALLGLTGCGQLADQVAKSHLVRPSQAPLAAKKPPTTAGDANRRKARRHRRGQADTKPVPLTELERRLYEHVRAERERMETLLEESVDLSSGSQDREGLRSASERFAKELEELGFALEWVAEPAIEIPGWEQHRSGDHLIARRGHDADAPHLVLLGHVDTIFEQESGFVGYQANGDKACGPGVLDMKGGIVVMIHALRALEAEGLLDRARFTVVLNADEETGSLTSRAIIERAARGADAVLVYEGSSAGHLVLSRGGLGQFRIRIEGKAVHVAQMQRGVDAIHELAIKIVHLKKLTNIERGITVNVAPVRGGFKRNRVADWADCEVDLRFTRRSDGPKLYKAVREIALKSYVRSPDKKARTRTYFWGTLHRPPMPRTSAAYDLAAHFRSAGRDLGHPCQLVFSRGGSDANLTANLGVPTVDGLGPVGTGAHTRQECVRLSSLGERAAMSAIGIARLLKAPRDPIASRDKSQPAGGGQ